MKDNDWKSRLGVVYSTNPDFQYETASEAEAETLPPAKQRLIVGIDRRNRGGKQVTLVTGFVGKADDLKELRHGQGRRNHHPGRPPRQGRRPAEGNGLSSQTR